jgi:tetratricopeptide (TPR) repeat protein
MVLSLLHAAPAGAHSGHGPEALPPAEALAAAARQPTPLARGKAFYEIGAMERAVAELNAALAQDPKSAEALRLRAMAHTHERRFPSAFADFEAALSLKPAPPLLYEILYFYGDAQFNAGIYDKAAAQFEKILALKPSHVDARCYLGEALFKQGRREEAVAAFQAALKLDPRSAWAHHSLGDVLAAMGRDADAIREYREDLRLVPHCHSARIGLARALEREGDLDGAVREYYTSLAYHLGDSEAHNGMGRIFFGRKEYARALAEYSRTLDFDSQNPQAKRGLEEARRKLGESAGQASASTELIFWRFVGSWLPAALVAVAFSLNRRRSRA